jgi:hypothetical protein
VCPVTPMVEPLYFLGSVGCFMQWYMQTSACRTAAVFATLQLALCQFARTATYSRPVPMVYERACCCIDEHAPAIITADLPLCCACVVGGCTTG